MYSLQRRDRATKRNPDLLRRFARLVRKRQVLPAIEEFAQQMNGRQTPATLRMHYELRADGGSNLSASKSEMPCRDTEEPENATAFTFID